MRVPHTGIMRCILHSCPVGPKLCNSGCNWSTWAPKILFLLPTEIKATFIKRKINQRLLLCRSILHKPLYIRNICMCFNFNAFFTKPIVVLTNLPDSEALAMNVAEGFEFKTELEPWTVVTPHLPPPSLFVFSSLQAWRFSGHGDCHSQWSEGKAEEVLLSTFMAHTSCQHHTLIQLDTAAYSC